MLENSFIVALPARCMLLPSHVSSRTLLSRLSPTDLDPLLPPPPLLEGHSHVLATRQRSIYALYLEVCVHMATQTHGYTRGYTDAYMYVRVSTPHIR